MWKLKLTIILNSVLFLSQLAFIFFTNSYSLIGDTLDSLIDILSLYIPLLSIYFSGKCKKDHDDCNLRILYDDSFTLLSSSLIFSYRMVLIINVILAFFRDPEISNSIYLIIVGAIGFLINIFSTILIGGHHEEQNDHGKNLMFATIFHLLSDTIGSLVILAIGLQIHFTDDYVLAKYLDLGITLFISVIAIVISFILMYNNLKTKNKLH